MDHALKQKILGLLDEHRIMTLATLRPDGWPQATIVGYVNDGLAIYFLVARQGQKFVNIARDPRVSIAIGEDTPNPSWISGLSMAAKVEEVVSAPERDRIYALMLQRYPEYAGFPRPEIDAMAALKAVPTVISVLDYTKGFGHSDLAKVDAGDFAPPCANVLAAVD